MSESLIKTMRELAEKLEITPKKGLGQNFLLNERIADRIVCAVQDLSRDKIIEIGPGLGALTEKLIKIDLPFAAVELDRKLAEYWRERNIKIYSADALKIDWDELFAGSKMGTIVSNLPFQIASRLVIEQSINFQRVTNMVLMFQKEVAERLLSKPNTSNYGLLSVIAQTFWEITAVCEVGPNEFWPAPKVASRVLRFHRLNPDCKPKDFFTLVKCAFVQRRKKLITNLFSYSKMTGVSLADLAAIMQEQNIAPNQRAQELSTKQFLDLYKAIAQTKNKEV